LRSRSRHGAFAWLVRKEWRELMASPAWWVLLALTGPLVGVSFIRAVSTYSEISEGAGTGCGAVCSPLLGVWAPTFAAYEVIAVFLLPFVAIRLMSNDRQSGALKLELQRPIANIVRVAAKALVLMIGCLVAGGAGLVAIGLWKYYGGPVSWPEIGAVAMGHVLNLGLTIAVAGVAAAVTDHPSTAAVVTLAFTVGMWIVEFASAVYGGVWSWIARFAPSAMVGEFSHGLVQTSTVVAALALIAGGFYVAATWLQLGASGAARTRRSLLLGMATLVIAIAAGSLPGSHDVSEARLSSFPEGAEEALERLDKPVRIEAHLAPEDPRRVDLERHALAKLKRIVPALDVQFISRTSTGLFEQADPSYGEIRYEVGGHRVIGRATTDEAVLEAIFEAADKDPNDGDDVAFAGHPVIARPVGASLAFYGVWPSLAALAAWLASRQRAPASL
jgi:ABC-type transport system involved in multi-copper enzyme maturation permease subunit